MTAMNAAMAYNFHNAVDGTYPDYTINYEKVLVLCGVLPPAFNPAVQSTTAAIK